MRKQIITALTMVLFLCIAMALAEPNTVVKKEPKQSSYEVNSTEPNDITDKDNFLKDGDN